MKKGQKLFSIYVDIDESDEKNLKAKCSISEYVVSSIQSRKICNFSDEKVKYIFIGSIFEFKGEREVVPFIKQEYDRFDLAKTDFGTTKASAIKKELNNNIPKEIATLKEWYAKDGNELWLEYIKLYQTKVTKTLNTMYTKEKKKIKMKTSKV